VPWSISLYPQFCAEFLGVKDTYVSSENHEGNSRAEAKRILFLVGISVCSCLLGVSRGNTIPGWSAHIHLFSS
jgi:hypothetical protein